MNSRFFKVKGLSALTLLVMTFSMVGCTQTLTTHSAGIEADKEAASAACKAWKPLTYSSKDTEQTQLEVRGNNAARGAYCD